nr:hypothetical protein [uncultured Blautia sp.]
METVLSTKIKNSFPGLALLMAGFLAGLLIPNFIYCFSWKQQAFSAIYLLTAYGKTGAEGTDYLLKIIWMRGSFFFLSLLCGFTVFGVPIAVGAMLFTGLELGMVFSMSILQFGLTGGAVAAALLFPQYLIYLPLWNVVYQMIYRESMGIWRNHGIFPRKVSDYFLKVFLYTMLYGVGIFLEWRVNPWILNKILDFSKFF